MSVWMKEISEGWWLKNFIQPLKNNARSRRSPRFLRKWPDCATLYKARTGKNMNEFIHPVYARKITIMDILALLFARNRRIMNRKSFFLTYIYEENPIWISSRYVSLKLPLLSYLKLRCESREHKTLLLYFWGF